MTDKPAVIVFNNVVDPYGYFASKWDLASTTAGKGASLVGINDAGGKFTSTNIEWALQETATTKELEDWDITLDKIVFDITNTTPAAEWEINWNSDDWTAQIGMPWGDVVLQIGQELTYKMKNLSGSASTNGQAVFVFGSTWANQTFKLAQANAIATAQCTIWITTEDIADNGFGYVTTNGYVRAFDTSTLDEWAPVYLSATVAWWLTSTKPATPNYVWKIGNCMKSHATEWIVFVNVVREWNRFGDDTNYSEFEDDWTMVANGDATVWEDLNFDPDRSGWPVATRPDDVTINNVFHKEFTSLNNQLCWAVQEVAHEYKLGTNLHPHCHLFLKSWESVGTTGVEFTFYWELRQSTGTTSWSVTLSATSAELWTTAGANKLNIYNGSIAGSAELWAQLAVTIARTWWDAGDVIVTTYWVHYEIDMMWSHTALEK
jgi:hypothetical protein